LFGIRYDTNELTTPFAVRNLTAGGAVGISVGSLGASGGIYAWDDPYVTAYRGNRVTLLGNSNTEGTQTEYPVGGSFEVIDAGGTVHADISFRGLALREYAQTNTPASGFGYFTVGTDGHAYLKNDNGALYKLSNPMKTGLALGDMTTTITNGTSKAYWIADQDGSFVSLDASVFTVSSAEGLQFDLNVNGSSVLSTKVYIDAGERSSLTSQTNYVFSSTNFTAGDIITWDIDVEGTGATGPQGKFRYIAR
jgi:hypothetical protein